MFSLFVNRKGQLTIQYIEIISGLDFPKNGNIVEQMKSLLSGIIVILIFASASLSAKLNPGAMEPTRFQISEVESELVVLQTGFQNLTVDTATKAESDYIVQQLDVPVFTASKEIVSETQLTLTTAKENLIKVFEVPQVTSRILAYPSPMRFSDGNGEITYRLNGNMDLEMKIYDMFGNQVFQKLYNSGSNGGQSGYNSPVLSVSETGSHLSAGVYFIMLFNEGKVLAKGKMAIIP